VLLELHVGGREAEGKVEWKEGRGKAEDEGQSIILRSRMLRVYLASTY